MPGIRKKNSARYRLAFLGGGAYTIPSYRALLEELSKKYDLTVYFEFYFEAKPLHYSIRTVPKSAKHRRWREFLFALMILKDHIFSPFDIIHTHSTFPTGFVGVILGKIFRIPVVVSLDAAEASALPELNFGDLLHPRRAAINKWVIQKADDVIVLTEFLKQEVERNMNITRTMNVIPRGVNRIKFKFNEKPLGNPLTILSVSYLNPIKDQETLLKTFARISAEVDAILIHIGEDFANGAIQRLAKQLSLESKIKFEGLVPNDALPPYYAQADILLHTSQYEGQAVVVNEALASGVLVCGTHVGLLADLAGNCCLTVRPRDAEGLARLVLNLLEDPQTIKRLRENGHQWTIQHDLQWTTQCHEKIYDRLLNSSKQ